MVRKRERDEAYILDLCDDVLGMQALRQHRFPFLLGDAGSSGRRVCLPVDAYYPDLRLVIEYREAQHTRPIAHFDKPHRLTISGVHRGEQRRVYDQRRREVLPVNGITLIELDHTLFSHTLNGRLHRVPSEDRAVLTRLLTGLTSP
ncbi:hypothetical protein [Bosea sp. (in: a-proteobacteria)]|uniref:hypothetical protein n=1 Tax=Bosea sp. (in: a-proteobacteria) TaxID=1871050 RepID=UPI002B458E18|nr:hypothetical protein [Bosea sp. (in: a-proteobacteria)]WRH59321.1 MAG: hypothetical protein RSE11_05940 [Bosea sp. (in: a-proteobacteria)]